ncbi:hypothetical protein LTR47_011666 [Exophiala xenobiotica]|nr:hypothetical protein LTR92_011152 [Exophiala xenobiotica]KAK5218831.1 hypothetical protein LTR47_011666 [Exophiala xenobiotica]KAK5242853.1 hypothetical protein LTS06_011236 [Exophiala xenobiotica]KAK5281574.1 hypothetical protein LTR40_004634 [Exophiala xenobiotica]KAK5310347.1 hypothetical protein LTR93_012049 [Exophiala xenobiotica]
MPQSRSKYFPDERRQHLEQNGLRLNFSSVAGSIPGFNATHARFDKLEKKSEDEESNRDSHVQYHWRSRDNRKGKSVPFSKSIPADIPGRHPLIVPANHPLAQNKFHKPLTGIKRMFTVFPYWDISFWVAFLFTVGCLIFIIASLFYWLPVAYPSTEFPKETTIGGDVLFFLGATLFQVGAVFLVFEAVNENQKGCFGWAVRELFCEVDPSSCTHHHQRNDKSADPLLQRRWRWWPSWHEFRTHYIHETGFVANISLAIGAIVFYVSGILVLPGIYGHLSQGVLWGVYWFSYLVGSVLFLFSGILLLLEPREKWYKPAPHVIGWHAGVWNLIGAVGWILSASFGYCSASWCEYQSDLTLLWASTAYKIGSAILWYEALDKYPVYTKKT